MSQRSSDNANDSVMPDLAELCRNHDVSLELIRGSHDMDELLDRVLAEFEARLQEALESEERTRARAIRQRQQMEKLADIMKTLSVLTHKINNPLTSLMGRAQMLRLTPGSTEPRVLKAAAVIEESSRRVAEYIRELALLVKDGRAEALRQVLDDDPRSTQREETQR